MLGGQWYLVQADEFDSAPQAHQLLDGLGHRPHLTKYRHLQQMQELCRHLQQMEGPYRHLQQMLELA